MLAILGHAVLTAGCVWWLVSTIERESGGVRIEIVRVLRQIRASDANATRTMSPDELPRGLPRPTSPSTPG